MLEKTSRGIAATLLLGVAACAGAPQAKTYLGTVALPEDGSADALAGRSIVASFTEEIAFHDPDAYGSEVWHDEIAVTYGTIFEPLRMSAPLYVIDWTTAPTTSSTVREDLVGAAALGLGFLVYYRAEAEQVWHQVKPMASGDPPYFTALTFKNVTGVRSYEAATSGASRAWPAATASATTEPVAPSASSMQLAFFPVVVSSPAPLEDAGYAYSFTLQRD